VETQNINVPACRFYVRMGCALLAINCMAYPELPGEAQLLWCKDLCDSQLQLAAESSESWLADCD